MRQGFLFAGRVIVTIDTDYQIQVLLGSQNWGNPTDPGDIATMRWAVHTASRCFFEYACNRKRWTWKSCDGGGRRRGCTCSPNITREVKHTSLFLIKALVEYTIKMKPQRVVTRGSKSAFENVIQHHSPPKITLLNDRAWAYNKGFMRKYSVSFHWPTKYAPIIKVLLSIRLAWPTKVEVSRWWNIVGATIQHL